MNPKRSVYGSVLILAAVFLLCYSVASTSVLWVEPADLGLGGKLPVAYWVGLAITCALWYVGRSKRFYLIVALLLTASYLYVAPAIIRVPPWISNSYYPYGESLLMNETGHLIDRPSRILVSYLDWPIFLYFASSLKLVTGLPDAIIVKVFPLFAIASYVLFATLILRIRMRLSYAVFGGAWLLGSFFIRQHYFGPQGFAYIYFLMSLLITSWLFFTESDRKTTLTVLLLFLLVVTTLAHPLTSLMLMIVMVSAYFTCKFITKKPTALIFTLCLISLLLWLGYNAYFAVGFFDLTAESFINILFGERSLNIYSEPSRLIGSRAMLYNFAGSWSIVILGSAIAALSVLLILKRTLGKRKATGLDYSVFISLLLVMLAFFSFSVEYGEVEAYQRAFMFGLVPLSYLCVDLLSRKGRLLVVLLAVVIFLNIPAQYGSDTYRLATDSTLEGAAFFAEYSPQRMNLIARLTLYIRYHNPLKQIVVPSLGISYPYTSLPNSSSVNKAFLDALTETDYVVLSELEKNSYMFYLGSNPLERIGFEDRCNRVYDNSRYWVFKPANATLP
jgi:hypothetical protein